MENLAWIFWALLGVALIVAEVFTLGFVLLWFGVGALAAGLAGFLGLGIFWQFIIFAVVSVALTAASRTLFSHHLPVGLVEGDVKTGVDSLPGQIGTVVSSSAGALNEGAVKVFGSTWTAFPEDNDVPLAAGEKVEVVRVEGASIYVKRVKELASGWLDEQ
jgi:membrane protein implicated in regulation of membrane protease activity